MKGDGISCITPTSLMGKTGDLMIIQPLCISETEVSNKQTKWGKYKKTHRRNIILWRKTSAFH